MRRRALAPPRREPLPHEPAWRRFAAACRPSTCARPAAVSSLPPPRPAAGRSPLAVDSAVAARCGRARGALVSHRCTQSNSRPRRTHGSRRGCRTKRVATRPFAGKPRQARETCTQVRGSKPSQGDTLQPRDRRSLCVQSTARRAVARLGGRAVSSARTFRAQAAVATRRSAGATRRGCDPIASRAVDERVLDAEDTWFGVRRDECGVHRRRWSVRLRASCGSSPDSTKTEHPRGVCAHA